MGEETDQDPIGKLPELREKASESASKIQAYVNYVLELTPYSSLTDKKVAKVNIFYKETITDHMISISKYVCHIQVTLPLPLPMCHCIKTSL